MASRDDIDSALKELARGEVQVVYAPSLDLSTATQDSFRLRAKGVWNTRDYLKSQVQRELQAYLSRLKVHKPKYWIDPRIRTRPDALYSLKRPNPVLSFLVEREKEFDGRLAILLAEPGQGKTYMSKYLAAEVAATDGLVPLAIESKQWGTMSVTDLPSLSKTMVHTFRFHQAPIVWLENHEEDFLNVMLKVDLLRIIFDGFDEYILANAGAILPMDALEKLAKLAKDTGSRIVITSRTSFWQTNLSADAVQDFDENHAKNYFQNRLSEAAKVAQATELFRQLQRTSAGLVGRGFVLNLIGDLVERERSDFVQTASGNVDFLWLLTEFCERETERQKLPFSAREQLDILRTIATEISQGERFSNRLIEVVIELCHPQIEPSVRSEALEKLKTHPLLQFDPTARSWNFREQQIPVLLISEQMLRSPEEWLQSFVERTTIDVGSREDLGNMLVDLAKSLPNGEGVAALKGLIKAVSKRRSETTYSAVVPTGGQRLAATVALVAVEKWFRRGSAHEDRSKFLLSLSDAGIIEGFAFSGTIGRYDLRGVKFSRCFFEQVLWANCKLDATTVFDRCKFTGGIPPAYTDGLGKTKFFNCFFDQQANAWLNAIRVREGERTYSGEDLKEDMCAVLNKFVIKGGIGLCSVHERDLGKGTISGSPHRGEIIDTLCAMVFEPHHVSGPGDKGFNIKATAVEAMKFYAGNNVFTGPLAAAYERLRSRLGV
jgi:hypothetical protein